jgi:hypothetical protein
LGAGTIKYSFSGNPGKYFYYNNHPVGVLLPCNSVARRREGAYIPTSIDQKTQLLRFQTDELSSNISAAI